MKQPVIDIQGLGMTYTSLKGEQVTAIDQRTVAALDQHSQRAVLDPVRFRIDVGDDVAAQMMSQFSKI